MASRRALVTALVFSCTLASCHGGPGTGGLPPSGRLPGGKTAHAALDVYASTILADGPAAYYRLDDTGSVAADLSGNSLNGTVGSSVTTGVTGLLASSNDAAMGFPGKQSAAGIVAVPANALLQPTASVSVETWLRFSQTPATYTVAVAYGSDKTFAPYDLYFNGGKIAAQFDLSSGALVVTSPSALQPNTTYYVVSTFDGTTANLYVNGALVASAAKSGTLTGYTPGAGLGIGDDAALSDPAFAGTLDEVAVYAGKALTATQVQNHYAAGESATPSPAPTFGPLTGQITAVSGSQFQVKFPSNCGSTPVVTNSNTVFTPQGATPKAGQAATVSGSGACANPVTAAQVVFPGLLTQPAFSDWNTFGDSLARTGYNPSETTISPANAPSMNTVWAVDLGAPITAQPIVATGMSVHGASTVLFVGTEGGKFYALNAATGATLWSKQLGWVSTNCLDLPGGKFGVTGTATYDKSSGRVYVADGKNEVHALSMQTGQEVAGWPVSIATMPYANHIYGALTYNPANGVLYAETASMCDARPWKGRIVAINAASATITNTFFPAAPYEGAGIWGLGGASVDASNDVYVATGNDVKAPSGGSAYGEHVVQLDPQLDVLAANDPGIKGYDVDFGATPMVFAPPGCATAIIAKNKSGKLIDWATASINSGPLQILTMAANDSNGQFIGVTAYSPAANLVYVGDPRGNTSFTHGLIALAPQADCTLAPAWQATLGNIAPFGANDNVTPAVANGVVFVEDGLNDAAYALNAASGQQLWSSGALIGGPALGAPVIDGRLFVGSWDHKLYAFGP